MPKFMVNLKETVFYTVDVEADNEEAAGKAAANIWANSPDPSNDFSGNSQGVEVDDVEPAAEASLMQKFTFSAKIHCSFEIEAATEEEAIAALEAAEMETGNLGALPDGSPIVARLETIEDSGGGEWSAAMIDDKEA